MEKHKIFISSVQKEFKEERIASFSDRLEVWNPGVLPPSLTIESLSKPHSSQPGNPLIAEPLFLTKYIEKAGTGTVDIFDNCRKAGLKPPDFRLENGFFILTVWRKQIEDKSTSSVAGQGTPQDTQQVTPQVRALLKAVKDEPKSRKELQMAVRIKDREHFRKAYIENLLIKGWLEMTIPDKPNSRLQKYRLTKKGADYLKRQGR